MSVDKKKETQMNEKKKAFIKEQIVPERNSRIKRGVLLVAAVAFCAVLFGLIASFTISFMGPYFDELAEKREGKKVSLEDSEEGEGAKEEGEKKTDSEESGKDGEGEAAEEGSSKEKPESEPIVVEKELTLDRIEEAYGLLRKTAKQYNSCIVNVSGVTQGVDWFDNPSQMEAAAYGVILAEDTERLYILTGYDTIHQVEKIQVTFSGNVSAEAKLCGKDKTTGLAVLSVAKGKLSKETLDYILVASLGDSYSLTEGTLVMALGSPNGYLYSMDFGMITSQRKEQFITDGKLELFYTNMGYYSGGAGIVINMEGKIIGFLTHNFDKEANSEICTMVGITRLKPVIEKMINRQKMAYAGIIANDIPEESREKLGASNGIYVTEVEGNSPALEAGLRAGDVITEIDGTQVVSVINYSNILAQYEPKDEIKVKIIRSASGGAGEQEVTVVLGSR